ncbi:MAG: REP-associated tyrosine transposase [Terriglobia bacterium]
MVLYSGTVSRLRRPFLSDRFFFVTVRLYKHRNELRDTDFQGLAQSFRRARFLHPFFLTAWVLLPDHWRAICAPAYPATISEVVKSIKISSMTLINRRRDEVGQLWQGRFFDRALRSVKEYNEKVEYIHLNPVKTGLVSSAQDWRWSSVNEYSGVSAREQERHCGLAIDRVNLPSDPKARI